MSLAILWFIVLALLWCGFLFLEGFDYGVGMLHYFVGRDDDERRVAINAIGPVWDGNEVWLIVAGAGMFAAFPEWYATMFSGFYLALVLLLARLARRRLLPQIRTGRRLALQESMALDSKRRLCLVTCDGRPLLLLIGGAQDIVVGWLPAEGAP